MLPKLLSLSLLLLVTSNVVGQNRVFHASPIDVQQDSRLDALEEKNRSIEAKLSEILAKLDTPKVSEPKVAESLPTPVATTTTSSRFSTSELRSLIRAKRPGGWTGPVYADVSPRSMAKQHLVGSEHGFSWDQVSGLSQEEALILHDLAPNHGNQIFPMRSVSKSVAPTVTQRVTTTTTMPVVTQKVTTTVMQSGCENGQCDRPVRYQRRGLFGFLK